MSAAFAGANAANIVNQQREARMAANLHVALAMALGESPQRTDDQLIEKVAQHKHQLTDLKTKLREALETIEEGELEAGLRMVEEASR